MTDESLLEAVPHEAHMDVPRPRRRWWAVIAAVIALIGAGVMWTLTRTHPRQETAAPYQVTGESVQIGSGSRTWKYLEFATAAVSGSIPPEPAPARVVVDETRSQPVVAPLQGRVDTVAVRLGQRVQSGNRLLAVRSPELVDLFKELDLLRSKEAAREKSLARVKALVALQAAAQKDLVAAQQDLQQVKLSREAAERKLRSLSVDPGIDGLYWLTAQRSGVVVQRDVLSGQEVGPDRAEPLMIVADLDEVIVTANVPEVDLSDLHIGQTAQVLSTAAPERQIIGRIEYIGEVVDPQRRMVDVRIRVQNPDHILRPNGFVQVAFAPVDKPEVVVPSDAIVTDDQQSFVFVRSADHPDQLQRRRIVRGHQRGGQVEILDGLSPGETYVTKGAILLLNAVDLAHE